MSQWACEASEATFEQEVIERSRTTPVLVDFWAEWCGPCRVLGPTIEAAVDAREGTVWLAKVDVDQNQGLAATFGIRGIPTVKAFVDGKAAAEFVGVRDRQGVDAFIDSLVPSDEEQALGQAAALHAEQRYDEAIAALQPVLDNPHQRDMALVLVAQAQIAQTDFANARTTLQQVSEGSSEESAAKSLLLRLEIAEAAGDQDEPTLRARVQTAPDDRDARWALAGRLLINHKTEQALEELLELVQRDRAYRDDGARRAIVSIFDGLGPDDDLTHEYRRRLQIYV